MLNNAEQVEFWNMVEAKGEMEQARQRARESALHCCQERSV
jgi:hypothetical protein